MAARFKAVRTDRELECPAIDAGLRAAGCELVLLPEGIERGRAVRGGARRRLAADVLHAGDRARHRGRAEAQGHRQIRRRHRRDRHRGRDGARHSGRERAGIRRGDGRRRRVRADDRAGEEADADRARDGRDRLGLADARNGSGSISPAARSGIVGTGKIGRSMARMAAGFRMRVIGYDPHVSGRRDAGRGHREGRRSGRAAGAERRRLDPRRAERARRGT